MRGTSVLSGVFLLLFGVLTTQAEDPSTTVFSANILFQDIRYFDSHASGRLTLEVCNLGSSELRNVNVRAATSVDLLNQGVVQFGAINGGVCASSSADFSLNTQQLDETGGVPIRIQYDAAGDSHEVLDIANIVDPNN